MNNVLTPDFESKGRVNIFVLLALPLCVLLLPLLLSLFSGTPKDAVPSPASILVSLTLYAMLAFCAIHQSLRCYGISYARAFGLSRTTCISAIGKGILFGFIGFIPLFSLLMGIKILIRGTGIAFPQQQIFTLLSQPDLAISFHLAIALFSVLIVPLYEEALFRGILYPTCYALSQKKTPFLGNWLQAPFRDQALSVLLTGALFAVLHRSFLLILPFFVLHLLFCWGYRSSHSLLTPILQHMTFNGINLALFYLFKSHLP